MQNYMKVAITSAGRAELFARLETVTNQIERQRKTLAESEDALDRIKENLNELEGLKSDYSLILENSVILDRP